MITVENLNLTMKKTDILKDVSVTFNEGKIYGLVGHNGCGKTMLMKCICGFVKPTSGKITVNDKVIGRDVDYIENAGIILETPNFIPYYSGLRNLKMLAAIKNNISLQQIMDTMELCGLNPELKRHVKKYSLGMRQRLGLAQALMEKPDILILDESFNGLDHDGVQDMYDILKRFKEEGKIIIISSHSSTDIEVLCDYVYEMENGKIK